MHFSCMLRGCCQHGGLCHDKLKEHPRRGGHPRLTDGVLLRGLLQHLGRDPALGARDAGAEAEALSSSLKLLAEAKIRDDSSDVPVAIRDGDEDVTGLQVTMDWKRECAASPANAWWGRSRASTAAGSRALPATPHVADPDSCCLNPSALAEDGTKMGHTTLQPARCPLTDAEGVEVGQPGHGLTQQRHRVQAAAIEAGAFHILEPHRGTKT